jgi:hypothetical protein
MSYLDNTWHLNNIQHVHHLFLLKYFMSVQY